MRVFLVCISIFCFPYFLQIAIKCGCGRCMMSSMGEEKGMRKKKSNRNYMEERMRKERKKEGVKASHHNSDGQQLRQTSLVH